MNRRRPRVSGKNKSPSIRIKCSHAMVSRTPTLKKKSPPSYDSELFVVLQNIPAVLRLSLSINSLLSHESRRTLSLVPLAMRCLTGLYTSWIPLPRVRIARSRSYVFGMGTGISTSLKPPGIAWLCPDFSGRQFPVRSVYRPKKIVSAVGIADLRSY